MDIEPKILTNNPTQVEPQVNNPDVSFGEALISAFRRHDPFVSAAEAFGTRGDREQARRRVTDDGIFIDGPDPNYDVFDDIEGTHYAAHDRSFIGVVNSAEARVVKDKIDNEQEDSRLLASMGCLLYTSPSPRDRTRSRMPSSA